MSPIVVFLILAGIGCAIGRFVYLVFIAASLEEVDLPDGMKREIMR